jgi:hypothetical protein
MRTTDLTQKLIKRAQETGLNPDEVVYSVCLGDVLECLAEVYEAEALAFTDSKLNELVEQGIKATEFIPWSETIEARLKEEKANVLDYP